MFNRRSLLRGLFVAPAVVASARLMPIRGVVMPLWEPVARWRPDSLSRWRMYPSFEAALLDVANSYKNEIETVRANFAGDPDGARNALKPRTETVEVLKFTTGRLPTHDLFRGMPNSKFHANAGDTVSIHWQQAIVHCPLDHIDYRQVRWPFPPETVTSTESAADARAPLRFCAPT